MFTGLIETRGRIAAVTRRGAGARVSVEAVFADGAAALGESIAVDGICLTAIRPGPRRFEADLSAETLDRTTAGAWRPGRKVNLERALLPTSRLGGHFVQGHVDGRGRVLAAGRARGQATLRVAFPDAIAPFVAFKGSIAVDGVSLTIAALEEGWFEVALVPHTLAATNLSDRRPRDAVNLEADVLARHLVRLFELGGHGRPPTRKSARPAPGSRIRGSSSTRRPR